MINERGTLDKILVFYYNRYELTLCVPFQNLFLLKPFRTVLLSRVCLLENHQYAYRLFVCGDRSYPLPHLAYFAVDYTLQLCLNSGEIIKMSPEMTMMFEVREDDLEYRGSPRSCNIWTDNTLFSAGRQGELVP